jgi:hypothetical protein
LPHRDYVDLDIYQELFIVERHSDIASNDAVGRKYPKSIDCFVTAVELQTRHIARLLEMMSRSCWE